MPIDTKEFLENSILNITIPLETNLNPERFIEYVDGAEPSIESRTILYFGR